MNSIIDIILAYIQRFFEWVVSTGLAEKTADAIGRIISFDGWEIDKLMWDWINTIFGQG
jgi:hypothetical protein